MNAKHEQVELLGRYDAVVVGGGVSGFAAARTMAAAGMKVGLLEQVSSLGREIVRARSIFVDLAGHQDDSPTIRLFYERMREHGGVFGGIVDPNGAAVVFDELLHRLGVDVLFHVWPAELLGDGKRTGGLIAATNTGYARVEAPVVIDASERGKLSRALFRTKTGLPGKSALRLLFSGISSPCPAELTLHAPGLGDVRVLCRPTFWPNEWQLSLHLERSMTRQQWASCLEPVVEALCERVPALAEGIVSYIGNDVWATPDFRVATGSRDRTVAGRLRLAGGETSVARGMLGDPESMSGFYMAGMWIDGLHVDPLREEEALVNGFVLGDLVGREAATFAARDGRLAAAKAESRA